MSVISHSLTSVIEKTFFRFRVNKYQAGWRYAFKSRVSDAWLQLESFFNTDDIQI